MNIYAQSGTKVRYNGIHGYDSDQHHIQSLGVKAGDILTVVDINIGSCFSYVYFAEIGGSHNSVMFDDIEEEEAQIKQPSQELWAVQWRENDGKWVVCQGFDKGRETACIYLDESDAQADLKEWQRSTTYQDRYRVVKVKVEVQP